MLAPGPTTCGVLIEGWAGHLKDTENLFAEVVGEPAVVQIRATENGRRLVRSLAYVNGQVQLSEGTPYRGKSR